MFIPPIIYSDEPHSENIKFGKERYAIIQEPDQYVNLFEGNKVLP